MNSKKREKIIDKGLSFLLIAIKALIQFTVAWIMYYLVKTHQYDYAAGCAVLIFYILVDAVREIGSDISKDIRDK